MAYGLSNAGIVFLEKQVWACYNKKVEKVEKRRIYETRIG